MAAIHATEDDDAPIGSGVLIDANRVLTCAHVMASAEGEYRLPWVSFPKSDSDERRRVDRITVPAKPLRDDVAVLHLAVPAPACADPARLRRPRPRDLVDGRWWAFGFPHGQFRGNAADGSIGETLASGWVRLDSASRYELEPGFSGAGVWSPDYEAVVGLVGQANVRPDGHRDGQAITVYRAADYLVGEDLAALADWTVGVAGEAALAAWGWSLTTDVEAVRHWRPRARGVSVDAEQGYRFRGRHRALTEIVTWLGHERLDRRVLVVTGSPGVGKSAVLGRVVTTADAEITASLPPDDDAVRAPVGSVACAVHAKGKTARDVARE